MSRFARRFWATFGVAIVLVLGLQAGAASADPPDFSSPGEAFNVLPPGQDGGFVATANSKDQIPLYDGLTPLKDNVATSDLPNFFKKNVFGLGGLSVKRVQTFPARPDLIVTRDSFNVPHIEAPTRDDVMYGIGFVTAEDRGLLMDTFRGPGRVAALDVPGLNPFPLAQGFQPFNSVPGDRGLPRLAGRRGPPGPARSADRRRHRQLPRRASTPSARWPATPARPWNRNDVIACAALIAAVFGKGGGDEARRAQLLSALKDRLGDREGEQVWNDLRELKDPETSVSIDGKFNQQAHKAKQRKGNAIIDADSIDTGRGRQLGGRTGVAAVGQQRDPGGGREVRDRAPVLRRGPAGRLLLPAGPDGDRRARRRHRRPRRDVPRCRPLRRAGPRASTTRGARPPRATTTSTSSSRSCAVTTRTTCSTGSAAR